MSTTLEKPATAAAETPRAAPPRSPIVPAAAQPRRRGFRRWLLHDSPYIIMLALALVGVTLRVQLDYWFVLMPIFGVMCILAGWRHRATTLERLGLVVSMVLSWGALGLAIAILYRNVVQGVVNASANDLAMLTLLALGTFMAGVQSRVWRICAIGAVLFLAVPGIGWVDKSALLLVAIAIGLIVVSGLIWWVEQRPRRAMA